MNTKLSDTQHDILTAAASGEDRIVRPSHVPLKGGAVRIMLASLLKRGLLEEVSAGEGDHAWWNSASEEPLALRVTVAGAEAVGAVSDAASLDVEVAAPASPPDAPAPKTFRANTKQAAMIALLRRPEGATIDEMAAATGWLAHTVRGAIAGALKKKLGMEVISEKIEGRGRLYRLPAS